MNRVLKEEILRLDHLQAELTIYPDGCPEPWRSWIIEAHHAMCDAVQAYQKQEQP